LPSAEPSLISKTNVSDDDMTIFYLSKQGYGSIVEIRELDTTEFLDLVEFEQITKAIEQHSIAEASKR